jgi:hypothetical protein
MSMRPLHFNAFIWPNGYHESAWRLAGDDVRGVLGLPYYAEITRIAERGLMDSIFLADNIPDRRVHRPVERVDVDRVPLGAAGQAGQHEHASNWPCGRAVSAPPSRDTT